MEVKGLQVKQAKGDICTGGGEEQVKKVKGGRRLINR